MFWQRRKIWTKFPARIKEMGTRTMLKNWSLKESLVSELKNLSAKIESFDIWRAYEAEPQLSSKHTVWPIRN